MAVTKGVGKIIAAAGIIFIVIIGLILISKVASGDTPSKSIILKTIELRSANEDSVRKAQTISALDTIISKADDVNVEEQWGKMTECLAISCPDDAYFDMIFVATNDHQTEIKNADLLLNLLVVNRYWDSADIVEFSKSLSEVDTQIQNLQNRKAKGAWADIVECNNECDQKANYYFELIRIITELS
jgi:hypothetical protein